jgi:hypothetical protein|tara:strand:+ start:2132 stop:2404 length:273 start_codon:yes stop_codon:yes gene_type:complete
MATQTYPAILVELYERTARFNGRGKLLHSFNCTRIGEMENGVAKAFYVDNYESFHGERPILHKGHPDIHFNYRRYDVHMESITLQHTYGI